jgi:hypothetical protein
MEIHVDHPFSIILLNYTNPNPNPKPNPMYPLPFISIFLTSTKN